ncbi:putative phage abortive infection protein [Paenibacillus sp. TAF43_2]|uniref:putative phage abortive infection protein n=1 Tax=Paenibacillus sp. TAF43_2 TaxID=3233069 RepID=UPI003F9D7E1D
MKSKNLKFFTWILFIISFLFFIIGISSPIMVKVLFKDSDTINDFAILGPIGDWLGGAASPFINSASFIILLVAYLAQKEELNLTRNEMKNQNLTLIHQRFDNTLFNLLHLHQQIISSLKHSEMDNFGKLKTYTAREIINTVYENLQKELDKKNKTSEELNMYDEITHVFYGTHTLIDQVFQSQISIIEFISSSTFEISKDTYWKIFRAQISNQESLLLFFYLAYWKRDERVALALKEDEFFMNFFNSLISSDYSSVLLRRICR